MGLGGVTQACVPTVAALALAAATAALLLVEQRAARAELVDEVELAFDVEGVDIQRGVVGVAGLEQQAAAGVTVGGVRDNVGLLRDRGEGQEDDEEERVQGAADGGAGGKRGGASVHRHLAVVGGVVGAGEGVAELAVACVRSAGGSESGAIGTGEQPNENDYITGLGFIPFSSSRVFVRSVWSR